ncbi:glutamyl-tRNA reductase [Alteromonas alba]|jgi:glutamyl-tRNA reductase|uniref:Glutamyl-tRNA reductase n=1 Tax=Alteromonas alba TaxID=2079529 RepID=A0A2S9V7Q1_9ALTE|nr:glutamyl-tRNA reductase [Alteromonas alba]PRO72490.1 glutamyl-tRNA reductase [Alteromonas alba]HCA77945.1 glutamyl-tRNA reductase [Alteromonas sp.]HCB15839.1 glutamyl-tRNA reductase [Alteromonas sp.]|tara:strand:+ start:4679 stop:5944 length:1266 start_codon:yes stop_codon:yes gene_type:complete
MTLIALGINHKTAPVELREKVAFTPDSLVEALSSLKHLNGVDESVIVSTCNRTEVYVSSETSCADQLIEWLAEFHNVDARQLSANAYIYEQAAAIEHVMKVASGLDSLVLGEPQILGQIKQAYNNAKHSGMVNTQFDKLFQHTFAVAKRVRTDTEIGANAVSVAFAAVQLAKHIFARLPERSVLLVGAGETIELVAQHLKEQGVQKLAVANRTRARAETLAASLGADVMTLSQLPQTLHRFDIVISSTASQLPLIGKGMVEDALKQRRNLPMFMVDLAVPRDIEAQVNELGDAYLYTVDDLQHIVQQNMASREQAAEEAVKIIQQQVMSYLQWQQSRQTVDLVKQYRDRGNLQRQELVDKALKQLQEGKAAEAVVEELAYKLTNNLLHAPTRALRDASTQVDQRTTKWLSRVFELDSDESR